jgi:hypothetical protein
MAFLTPELGTVPISVLNDFGTLLPVDIITFFLLIEEWPLTSVI